MDDKIRRAAARGEAAAYLREIVLGHDGDECLFWPFGRDGHGYGHIRINRVMRGVHRLVCEHVHGPAPTLKYQAAHSCGKGHEGCVNPRHLSWKTAKDNAEDRFEHGTVNRRKEPVLVGQACGERVVTSKLKEADIRQIRALKGQMSVTAIARMFGVGAPHISRIHSGAKWAHII